MFLAIVITAVIAFAGGYLVGSNNPAKSVVNKLKEQLKSKL